MIRAGIIVTEWNFEVFQFPEEFFVVSHGDQNIQVTWF